MRSRRSLRGMTRDVPGQRQEGLSYSPNLTSWGTAYRGTGIDRERLVIVSTRGASLPGAFVQKEALLPNTSSHRTEVRRPIARAAWIAAVILAGACGGSEPAREPESASPAPPAAAPRAPLPAVAVYVTNETSGDLTIIDAATATALQTIPLGKRPRGLSASPDRRLLYVALSGSPVAGPGVDESKLPPPDRSADGIGVVDVEQRKLVRVLESGTDPEQVAVSLDGKHLYVANEDAALLSVVDATSGKVLHTFKVGEEPEGVSVHPRNGHVYVTSEDAGAVHVIDPAGQKELAAIKVGPRPRSIAFLPDGSKAYVTNENGASLSVIDTTALKVARTIALGDGMRPMGAVASPDGAFVYVSTGRSRMVQTIDARKDAVTGAVEVGVRPWGIGISPDGRTVYTANGPAHDVSVVDLGSGKVTSRITGAGQGPWGIVVVARP
jgi:YVTN family beta-propeller protein